jgi:signal peptidase II
MTELFPSSQSDEPLAPATTRQRSRLILVAALVLVLDQLSKYAVEAAVPLYQSWAPIPALEPVLRFTHATNTGAAFGMFPDGSLIFTIAALLIGLAILYYNYILPGGIWLLRLALGLQLGGAMGNLLDRLRQGHVTDFIDMGILWPFIFNVADAAIVTGVILLGWLMVQEQIQEYRAQSTRANTNAAPSTDELHNS